jgi:hypothetical protein
MSKPNKTLSQRLNIGLSIFTVGRTCEHGALHHAILEHLVQLL